MKNKRIKIAIAFLLLAGVSNAQISGDMLEINGNIRKSKRVKPVEYGFHYEEIGMMGEGGLYAEMVRNRGLEEATPPRDLAVMNEQYVDVVNPTGPNKKVFHVSPTIGWETFPLSYSPIDIERVKTNPLNDRNPYSLKVKVHKNFRDYNGASVINTGFFGMNFKAGEKYRLSLYARSGSYKGHLKITLADINAESISEPVIVETISGIWKKYEFILTAKEDDERGCLKIEPSDIGDFQLDLVSMFPCNTWDNGKSVFRSDIIQNLIDYSPDFLRFPGGCVVHGVNEETMYHWKETIGDISQRPGAWSKWGPFFRTDGLGYHEFYELCEYIGADAMYVTPTGMVCTEFLHRDENRVFEHLDTDINYYIQDALDAIEYAIGDIDTKWGAERAKNGHPKPFPLKYVEIGNEDFGPEYYKRYKKIYDAIKAKYPELTLISSSIIFKEENDKRKYIKDYISPDDIEIYDEHYYQTPEWVIENYYKFDKYDRNGPDIFIGELGIGGGYPRGILAEGVLKMSLERNGDMNPLMADRPLMRNWDYIRDTDACPLFLHTTSKSIKTFNYYLCKMLRDNKIDVSYNVTVNNGTDESSDIFATLGKDKYKDEYILKIINMSDKSYMINLSIDGIKGIKSCEVTTLKTDVETKQTPDKVDVVSPNVESVNILFPSQISISPYSFTIYRFK